jgi:cobalt/nickel transport system permease protein
MAGGHAHALYRHGDSGVHRFPAHLKIVVVFAFVVAVVLTPREQVWAFGVYVAIVVMVMAVARLGARFVALRLLVLVPFVLAAATLPFLEGPPRIGPGLSIEGLWDAWNILAKGMLGTMASVLLAATTEAPDIVGGLERLRVPRVVTGIMAFMIRYIEVVADELARNRIAMRSRGYVPRGLASVGALGRSIGSLFVRSFERGERVYLAMVSRGYQGSVPPGPAAEVTPTVVGWTLMGLAGVWTITATAMIVS